MNKKHLLAASVLLGVPFLLSSTAHAEETTDNTSITSEESHTPTDNVETPASSDNTTEKVSTEEIITQPTEADDTSTDTQANVEQETHLSPNTQGVTRERAMEWAYTKKAYYDQNPLYWGGDHSKPYGMDVDGQYGSQCVDWIRGYAIDLWKQDIFKTGNAINIWRLEKISLPEGWERIENYDAFVPQPGDIAFFRTHDNNPQYRHPYGHTGIITSATNTTYNSIDQNVTAGKYKGNFVYGTPPVERFNQPYFSRDYGTFLGVIRPKFVEAHVPVITTKEETRTEAIPKPETIRIEDTTLDKGKENLVAGNEGIREIVERITLTDGNETNREKISENVIVEPKADSIHIGTKVTPTQDSLIQFQVEAGKVSFDIMTKPHYKVELSLFGSHFIESQADHNGLVRFGTQSGFLHEGDIIKYRLYDTSGHKVDEGEYVVQGHPQYAAAPVLDSIKVGDSVIRGTATPNSEVFVSYRMDGRSTNHLGVAFGGTVTSDSNGRFELNLNQATLVTVGPPTPAPKTLPNGALVSAYVWNSGYQGRITTILLNNTPESNQPPVT